MERVSEYFLGLSADTKARYTSKVIAAGLKSDPYAIPNESWVVEPDAIPDIAWSDNYVLVYDFNTKPIHTGGAEGKLTYVT